ncbi:MAG: ribonuclease HI [Desulfobacula sp.]|nr:ribonuclease HI [Desulfobacula sp.]
MNDQHQANSWKRMSFKGNKVWVATEANGNLLVEKAKVLIKYNLKQDYEYRVKPESLNPEDQAVPARKKPEKKPGKKPDKKPDRSSKKPDIEASLPDNCIKIYTDGASSGNPGPSGIGILFIYEENKKKISRYIGKATNNIAELTAIKVALEELKRVDLPVRIFSDSSYAIGLLTKNWKPKKNQELVNEIRALICKFFDLAFIKVKGHSGIKENEIADFLATSAIKKDLL